MSLRSPPTGPTGRALVVAFAAVAITFTVAIGVAQGYSLRIHSAAREITGNASPSISVLSAMRGTMRRLDVLFHDHLDRCHVGACPPAPPRIAELRTALRSDWERYRQLPTFPHERERWPAIEAELARLDEALGLALRDGRGGPVERSLDRLDDALAGSIQFDHDQGVALASRIDALARRSITLSVALDLASIALTAVAAGFAITLVKRYERLQRERAEELDQFAGRVAHDLLSPLGATLAAIQLAGRSADEKGRAALAAAERCVWRTRRMVDGLLDFARGGGPPEERAATDVQGVIDEVVEEQQPFAVRQRVRVELDGSIDGRVACDPGLLTSVVTNLVRNAIKYMGESEVRQVAIRACHTGGGRRVRVEVEDSGPGVPDPPGQRVFEPFVRGPATGEQGVGLGLATAKRIVTAHGGEIGLSRRRRDRGSVFWFELPVARGSGQP